MALIKESCPHIDDMKKHAPFFFNNTFAIIFCVKTLQKFAPNLRFFLEKIIFMRNILVYVARILFNYYAQHI